MEKKNVTHTARLCIRLWNIGLLALVWFLYYNKYTFDTYRLYGGLVSVLIYGILYQFFCQLYQAFKIASYQISETVFSQFIAFGLSDLILYVECSLIHNRMVSLLPGLLAVAMQFAGTAVFVTFFKHYFMENVRPRETVILYGEKVSKEEIIQFKERILDKYRHLFFIREMLPEKEHEKVLKKYQTVLLYEVSPMLRGSIVEYCVREKKALYLTPSLEDIVLQGCTMRHLLDTPLLKYDYPYRKNQLYVGKRIMDVLLSLVTIILASPFMLLAALAIRLEDKGPVFYRQKRYTKDGKVFEILKFRSMVVDAERNGAAPCTQNDSRITKTGKILRRLRFDELPQLFNILKGDMSLVGPRPERVEHVKKYMEELPQFAYRMNVKGGLTGYAQIYGKYNTSAYDKLRLDLMYIENQSLILDIKLLLMTIKIIFMPESTEGFSEEASKKIAQGSMSLFQLEHSEGKQAKLRELSKQG